MSLRYQSPPTSGALRQGEVIRGLVEHRIVAPAGEIAPATVLTTDPIKRRLVVVMTADCDLLQDFNARGTSDSEELPHVIPHALLFDLYDPAEIRPRAGSTDLWKRVRQNEDQRYHTLAAADVGESASAAIPELCIDFRKGFGIPLAQIYEALRMGLVERVALVPDIWIQQLMQRCYNYLGRVGLPE